VQLGKGASGKPASPVRSIWSPLSFAAKAGSFVWSASEYRKNAIEGQGGGQSFYRKKVMTIGPFGAMLRPVQGADSMDVIWLSRLKSGLNLTPAWNCFGPSVLGVRRNIKSWTAAPALDWQRSALMWRTPTTAYLASKDPVGMSSPYSPAF
jgi:hypothetical protein